MKSKSKKKLITGLTAVVIIVFAAFAYTHISGGEANSMTEVFASRQDVITFYSFTGNIKAHDAQYVLLSAMNR